MSDKPIYLDYNSTTPVDPKVLEAMLPYFSEKFGNAASKAHAYGWIAEDAVEQAREKVAELINATPNEITFTSGATEAINLALKGTFEAYNLKGNHIITSSIEHKAVLDTLDYLKNKGVEISFLKPDRTGVVDPEELKALIRPDTILVCIMMANNETGMIQPISELSRITHDKNSLFMTDATQAIGKIQVDVNSEGIDILCLSSHKCYGPKGSGAIYLRRKDPRVKVIPLIHGGGHERNIRSGTLNVPGIVGLGKACEVAMEEMWDESARLSKLRTRLEHEILNLGDTFVNGVQRNRLPNVTNISIKGVSANSLIKELGNIAVSTGSACTSAVPEPSHVLKAMGIEDELAFASIRFSLGRFTTKEEIELTIDSVQKAVKKLREVN